MNARLGLNVVSFQTAGNKPKCWSGSFPSPPGGGVDGHKGRRSGAGARPRDGSQLGTVN
jgi:hypothetical protein